MNQPECGEHFRVYGMPRIYAANPAFEAVREGYRSQIGFWLMTWRRPWSTAAGSGLLWAIHRAVVDDFGNLVAVA